RCSRERPVARRLRYTRCRIGRAGGKRNGGEMRIGINAALTGAGEGYRQTGISRYIGELVSSLRPQLAVDDDLVLFGNDSRLISERPGARIAWEQTVLPAAAIAKGVDVLHGPLSVVPAIPGFRKVVTVHDLAFVRYPEQIARSRRAYLVAGTRLGARIADRIIAVSTKTADDLMAWLDVPADRIMVIPLAPSPKVSRLIGDALERFKVTMGLQRPYLLAVGTLEPRKNLPFLLDAFAAVKDTIPHDLVLVGPEGWLNGPFRERLERLKLGDRVRLTGFVSDEDLGAWYSGADLFAFPSIYEGFGLPTVEAMSCGAPVLTSSSSCFPEVVGDAGVMVAPDDRAGWSEAIVRILRDAVLRDDLRARGLARAAGFSWERTAAQTYDIYRTVANA
ncbi:MAG TPA: glycosyltransferase family 1 protein, partial [Thermomicrobiales bacterium]|nr:glycosyltransferase family 1 protein [Thermomicrobiales bacterium]